MRQALAGMLWSKQSLLLRRRRLAARAPAPTRCASPQRPRHAQRGVVPHGQPRRDLDARHVGVPVVRGVGPGVPLRPAGDGRPRLRQVAARPDAVAGLPPPERADPRLRVELRRRQPAGPRLRHAVHAHASPATSATSTCRSCASRSPGCCSTSRGGSTARTPPGKNVFEGGFLGLDNIGVFDRSAPLPTGGRLEQADGTAWMALFSQNMLELALALAERRSRLRRLRVQVRRALLLDRRRRRPDRRPPRRDVGRRGRLLLRRAAPPDGTGERLKVRSLVGLLPLCATTVISASRARAHPELTARIAQLPASATATCWPTSPTRSSRASRAAGCCRSSTRTSCAGSSTGCSTRTASSVPTASARSPAPTSTSPYEFVVEGNTYRVQYEPAESTTGMFGGNSNWRGPVWFPVNLLIVRALLQHYRYYGDDFTIECPTGSGNQMTLFEVAKEIADRLIATFLRRPRRHAAGVRRHRGVPGRPALARPDPVLRVLPRRQRRRARRLAPDRLDRAGRAADPAVRAPRRRRRCSSPRTGRSPGRTGGSTGEAIADVGDGPRGPRRPPVRLPGNPLVHEIFTWVWLAELSAARRRAGHAGRRAGRGVGRHRRRRGRRRVADGGVGAQPGRRGDRPRSTRRWPPPSAPPCPTCTDDDVVGSAYCIRDYPVDDAPRRRRRPGRGPRASWRPAASALVLDFVPNHVAPDHPWATEHPEYFVRGTADDLARDPDSFLAVGDAVIARGPRPVLPGLAGGAAARHVVAGDCGPPRPTVVASIAERCDGVRCDMAMLMLDDVFARTWGERATGGPSPDGGRGYWPTVIGAVRAAPPGLRVLGRGVLGPRAGARRAGLRRLLRQAALRPPRRPRAGVIDPRPPRRRSGVPGAHRALRGEPRRAAPRRRRCPPPAARAAAVVGADAARRGPAPRGPGRRSPGAGAR